MRDQRTNHLGTSAIPGTDFEPFVTCLDPTLLPASDAETAGATASGGIDGARLVAKLPDGSWVPIDDPRANQPGVTLHMLAANPHPAPAALNARGGVVMQLPRALQMQLQQAQALINPPQFNPAIPGPAGAILRPNPNAPAQPAAQPAPNKRAGNGVWPAAILQGLDLADPCNRDPDDAKIRIDEQAVAGIAVSSGTWASVVSFTVPNGFRAHIEKIGVEVETGLVANWRWRLTVNGTPRRPWLSLVYPPGGMAPHEMAPCDLALRAKDVVAIEAYQTDSGTINTYGRILGVMKQC